MRIQQGETTPLQELQEQLIVLTVPPGMQQGGEEALKALADIPNPAGSL